MDSLIRLADKLGSRRILMAGILVLALALPQAGTLAFPGNPPGHVPPVEAFSVEVVSSAPHQVSGGDARLHIQVPQVVPPHQVQVLVNGVDQSDRFTLLPESRTLTGVIDGLALGENSVEVKPNGKGKGRPAPVSLTLTNYPVTGPIFSGPHQHPFVCTVQTSGLGQPLVDNPTTGIPVLDESEQVIGYSKDCSINPQVIYVYKSTDGSFKPYDLNGPKPDDVAQTTTIEGQTVDFIVRWERGTINRFIYSVAMLAPFDSSPEDLNKDAWTGRLLFQFDGGVAIGHSQGRPSNSSMLNDLALARGYAVIYSTGNRTNTLYNLMLGGETALMVKERFIELYDVPLYTVGLGGSGGAIQQYIYAQNHPGLLDAAIPVYSYPDMVTQAVHVGDCEPLEFFMDVLDAANPRWSDWPNRTLLEGFNASITVENFYTGSLGASECVIGWRGLSPLALNPNYGAVPNQGDYVPQSDIAAIEWTHFADLVNIFGVDEDGYARNYWDNVGVQYGLKSVASGAITPEEFLKVNHTIGGWKDEPDMVQEGLPFYPIGDWDPWSSRNQVFSTDPNIPAQRTMGNLDAMRAAYEAGLVFMGDIDIPVLDWRHYLEDELDMHNSHQSFAARQRMRDGKGDSENQVIWFTDVVEDISEFNQGPMLLETMDAWMMSILAHPERSVAENKPSQAVDGCFDAYGNEIAAGEDVWDGILDDNDPGACTQQFQIYSTSRIVAGGPFRGSIFKCHLKSVEQAIADGDYGVWEPSPAEQAILENIFPTGVCDFSRPDLGLPPGW